MSRETMIYYSNLVAVTGRIIAEKQVYDEPWDITDKDYLLEYVNKITEALSEHNNSKLVQAAGDLASELKSIIHREYLVRVHYIDNDLRYLKGLNICIRFAKLDEMSRKAEALLKEFPENEPVAFLMRFDEVHQYYYYHGMIEEFIQELSSYIEFAKALGDKAAAEKLISILMRCNSVGSKYIDENNLFYITPEANMVIENMLKNF